MFFTGGTLSPPPVSPQGSDHIIIAPRWRTVDVWLLTVDWRNVPFHQLLTVNCQLSLRSAKRASRVVSEDPSCDWGSYFLTFSSISNKSRILNLKLLRQLSWNQIRWASVSKYYTFTLDWAGSFFRKVDAKSPILKYFFLQSSSASAGSGFLCRVIGSFLLIVRWRVPMRSIWYCAAADRLSGCNNRSS